MTIDWQKIRTNPWSPERPPDWPAGMRSISLEGLSLLGIDERTKRLHWDGEEIVTRSVVRLGNLERGLAALAAVSTLGSS